MSARATYDRVGQSYSATRQPDPRIAAAIDEALQGMATVANIGAGAGSYEPPNTVVAVEPSGVMIAQRRAVAAPVIRAVAEHLPIRTDAVDAALAILTIHHWSDVAAGVAEMIRVARRRVVIFTWDDTVFREFWLLREYLPTAADTDAQLAVPIAELVSLLGHASVRTVAIPHDCVDGFGGAYWRRPQAYLDPTVRAGMSMLALTAKPAVQQGLSRLSADLDSGEWTHRHADLLDQPELDLGYRLVVSDQA
ncbi:class I SAM-dependent methyltransferase [Mycobacterium kyorinense]|uniref:MerR family transcriptional regulator n=1 Tax=Mycobacterium kyorinense TaxID=487514 RepID=A0A1X1Y8T0_9MYCO|nr:methyltransferase domain-containing protein [Mycobacterium kyorinense]ORW07469.1 MerR family transcriptional regulator [Mycobacterium kyorinense]